MTAPDLWHYTCDHGARGIGRRGLLLPVRRHDPDAAARLGPWRWLADLIWMTPMHPPDPHLLGLTANTIRCDRTAYRYRVLRPDLAQPWLGSPWHAQHPDWTTGGDDPSMWWVADQPVLVARVSLVTA